jgi:hypothetical protein
MRGGDSGSENLLTVFVCNKREDGNGNRQVTRATRQLIKIYV